MDKDFFLFDLNRDKLRKIFFKLTKADRKISFLDFQKLCLTSKLIPVIKIQNFVTQNQLRSIAGKFGNLSSLLKLCLNFDQFEQFLKIISISRQQTSTRSEKVKFFFRNLGQSLKTQFLLDSKTTINRSNTRVSLVSSQDLNESNSSLDISIKEALNTLKVDKKEDFNGRISISPRLLGKVYSNTSSPRNRNRGLTLEEDTKNKNFVLMSSQTQKNSLRFKSKNPGELDEFLETEKLVQKEVMNIKVNLKVKDIKKPQEKDEKPTRIQKTSLEESKTLIKENYQETKILELFKSIDKHQNFISHIQQKHISKRFMLYMAFGLWKLIFKTNKYTKI